MIKIEFTEVFGWDACVRGMRNPMNSWHLSDSHWTYIENEQTLNRAKFQFFLGENDLKLMKNLSKAGDDHAKCLRMLTVTCDITAPRYWWTEYDTYKVGTVANSCSTMHKIHTKEFTLDDFSHEHLGGTSLHYLRGYIRNLNEHRRLFNNFDNLEDDFVKALQLVKKDYWWQMIQLLPQSYNQRRTVLLNYQVLEHMYHARKNHKLDEWREFCKWCESLPYFTEICVND